MLGCLCPKGYENTTLGRRKHENVARIGRIVNPICRANHAIRQGSKGHREDYHD